jgi:enolase-phosphatase E1
VPLQTDPGLTRAIVLDVEGTTTPISFVYDVLFPYARVRMSSFLQTHPGDPEVLTHVHLLREEHEADQENETLPPAWDEEHEIDSAGRYALWLMDKDRKSTVLKWLQGRIWTEGYRRGQLRSIVFPDVPPALERWHRARKKIAIFSSGSILAQKDLFAHTESGDLRQYLDEYFDTTIGAKQISLSYTRIAERLGEAPEDTLFVSDVVAELDAARGAGYDTRVCVRPRNRPLPHTNSHELIQSFDGLI